MSGEPRDFGPYRLIRRLGVGGMAETFEASRIGAGGFEQRVCLKRVLPAFSEDAEFVSRFQREARLAAMLRHTNIVGVIDAGQIDGAHYMALELVDGVDLRSFLKSCPEGRLPPDFVALIGIDLAHALEHAHGSLVHRDISPSNILLSRSGEAKLADFGIAKAIENAPVTASRSANGKIPYMAPERMRGESTDARADLFSLGVVMFEALSGVRPFDGAHDVETMQKILEGNRRSLSETAPRAPAALRELIERLLETNAGARIQSATELLDALAVVAPTPSVRQSLAATIEEQRGGPEARLHVRARDAERDTELTRAPEIVPESPDTKARKSRPGRALLFASLLGAAAAILIVASRPGSEPTSAEEQHPAPDPADAVADARAGTAKPGAKAPPSPKGAEGGIRAGAGGSDVAQPLTRNTGAVAVADTVAVADADTGAVAGADTDSRRAVPKGLVRVVVQPWGNVWIDDRSFGRAPVKARLSKGRHVIEVGQELRSQRRVVRVRAGARQEVEFTLSEE